MAMETLEDALKHEMTDMLSAENQFAKALRQVAKAADSPEVKQMAEEHLQETLQQIDNLKQAFTAAGIKPERGMVCKGAQGICEENEEVLKEEKPTGTLKDVALIAGGLRIEHYEIAGYLSTIGLAKTMGQKEVVQLLQANLKQEQATAKKLESAAQMKLKDSRNGSANGGMANGNGAADKSSGNGAGGMRRGGSRSKKS